MSPNDADGMANSLDPDQTAPRSGSSLFALVYLSENLGSLWYQQRKLTKETSGLEKMFTMTSQAFTGREQAKLVLENW